jgi:hypothetical protein
MAVFFAQIIDVARKTAYNYHITGREVKFDG